MGGKHGGMYLTAAMVERRKVEWDTTRGCAGELRYRAVVLSGDAMAGARYSSQMRRKRPERVAGMRGGRHEEGPPTAEAFQCHDDAAEPEYPNGRGQGVRVFRVTTIPAPVLRWLKDNRNQHLEAPIP